MWCNHGYETKVPKSVAKKFPKDSIYKRKTSSELSAEEEQEYIS